jgi:hypothetical protein
MKPLLDKLGYRVGMGTQVWRLPEALRRELAPLLADASDTPGFRIAFARDQAELVLVANEVAAAYSPGGHLWLCYPKKSGNLPTELTRDLGWEPIQALGLYGVTQVALDSDWSALRFRKRDEIASLTRRIPTGGDRAV